jgi:hypothetical protein
MLIYTKRALPCNNNLNLRRRPTAKECCGNGRQHVRLRPTSNLRNASASRLSAFAGSLQSWYGAKRSSGEQCGLTDVNPGGEELVTLKRAAGELGLTPEGLRRRLIRVGVGQRVGARWYIPARIVLEMRDTAKRAAEILWGRRE